MPPERVLRLRRPLSRAVVGNRTRRRWRHAPWAVGEWERDPLLPVAALVVRSVIPVVDCVRTPGTRCADCPRSSGCSSSCCSRSPVRPRGGFASRATPIALQTHCPGDRHRTPAPSGEDDNFSGSSGHRHGPRNGSPAHLLIINRHRPVLVGTGAAAALDRPTSLSPSSRCSRVVGTAGGVFTHAATRQGARHRCSAGRAGAALDRAGLARAENVRFAGVSRPSP